MFRKVEGEQGILSEHSSETGDVHFKPKIKVYRRRFYMLALYCSLTWMNAVCWISLSPIASTVKSVYGVDDFQVNLIALSYLIAFLPSMLLATFIFDKLDLRNGLIFGAVLQGLGAAAKYFINQGFWIVIAGQFLIAISQPFFLDSPALVSTYWFESSLYEIALTLGTNFNTIGIAVGFIIPTLFVDSKIENVNTTKSQIELSLLVQGVAWVTIMLLTIFTFQNKPKKAPSDAAEVERDDRICHSYKLLLQNWEFIKLWICFSCFFTNILVLSTIIDKIVQRHGFNTDDSGFFGTMNIAGGFAFSFVYGLILNRCKIYKTLNISIGIFTILAQIGFYFSLRTEIKWVVTIAYALWGWSFATLNVSFGFSSEITFPIKEATASGLFILGSQALGFGTTNIWTVVMNSFDDSKGEIIAFAILIFINVIGTLSAISMKQYKSIRNITPIMNSLDASNNMIDTSFSGSEESFQDKMLS